MKLKVFTLHMNPAMGIFDEKELADFQLGKDIIEISEYSGKFGQMPRVLGPLDALGTKRTARRACW